LEGALAQADRERDSLRAERDKARAEVERIMGLLHDKAWMLAACLTIAEGGSARANEPTYLNSPAMDAVRDVVRERDSLRAERDAEQRRAMAAESERDVLREEHTARVLENSDLAHERDEAREERDSLRDQLAECQRVLALGEKVDAITKEKIARLERGVREARWLTQRSEWSPNNSGTRLSAFDWTQVEDEYDERRAAWLKEFGS
jgi:DNA polymerase III psi subunit